MAFFIFLSFFVCFLERVHNSTCVAVEFDSSQEVGFFHEIMLCKQVDSAGFFLCVSKV